MLYIVMKPMQDNPRVYVRHGKLYKDKRRAVNLAEKLGRRAYVADIHNVPVYIAGKGAV